MIYVIPEGLNDLELLYECKQKAEETLIDIKDIEETLLSALKERELVFGDMLNTKIDFDKVFQDSLEKAVDKAVKQEYPYIGEDKVIELYANYDDTNEFLLKTVYENIEDGALAIEDGLYEKIYEAYDIQIIETENEIIHAVGEFDTNLEDIVRDCIRDKYSIEPPYEHFLSQTMDVNIMLATPEEKNSDCCLISDQFDALRDSDSINNPEEILAMSSGLTYLLSQQGYSMDDLAKELKSFNKFFYEDEHPGSSVSTLIDLYYDTHNHFLTSLCHELENHTYSMGAMTVLARMPMKDFIEMEKGNKDVVFPKDAMIGIFNPWNGSGSLLEVELDKEFSFSTDLIRDVQIEGVKPGYEYTVNDAYGLIGSCWKELEIKDSPVPELTMELGDKKPALADLISDAEAKRAVSEHSNDEKMIEK